MKTFATLVLFIALTACAPPVANAPPSTQTAPPSAPVTAPESPPSDISAEDCAQRGGAMQPVGRRRMLQCVIPFADGGRACTDGAQCVSGRCIDESPQEGNAKASGVCQRTNVQFGCFATVRAGRREAAICVD